MYSYIHTGPGERKRWVVSTTPQSLYSWERDAVPVVQEAGWARKVSPPLSLDHPARSKLLYHLTVQATTYTVHICKHSPVDTYMS